MRAVRGGAGPAAPPPGRGCRVPGGPGPRVLPCSALPAHPLRSPRERSSARGAPQAAMSCAVPAAGGSQQSHEEDDRKVRRREKNRVAAQRSRKKQTQKADKLHEEYESLEQENTSLRREIGKLTDEMKHLSEVLKDHEKVCPLLHCTMNFVTIPRPDALTGCLPR
ncbi:basic leucine zipper transcriptional factor ATF-like 3 isoform X3 [Neopsephotus bourkii]|uniref:basic leucine zipper transcriptional factor ATF-like 3 isoform X3 n=1 Tax=Neopsephotus bourkii TaxID=309878 RepID=UPI002AA50D0B|nr:basic leucine zipper transcriptional factor ATF-like 3 isoform X3 [Neopsephotus bourkii]